MIQSVELCDAPPCGNRTNDRLFAHWTVFVGLAFLLLASHRGMAAPPLNQRVLVVYNSGNSDSIDVANYYIAKRGIPSANLCAITPPATNWLYWSAFDTSVRTPIRNCLNALGSTNILYIVFAYQTPYDIIAPDNATYSLDQFVADIWDVYTPPGQYGAPPLAQPYYADAQTQGNAYVPFVSLADFRTQNPVAIYSVWRLDAATPALAKGLVDKALATEAAGLSGQVCIDELSPSPTYDSDYASGDWDLRMAGVFSRLAGFSVTEDPNSAEFGTSPAPLRCDNAALYSGWYSYSHYNDAFTWNTGAIGFHLDSAAASDPRGGTNWSANAIIHGITVTSGAVAEPYIIGWARPDGVFRNLFEGANVGDAFLRNTLWLKWMIMNVGDPLYRPFPTGFPAVTAPHNSLFLSPQYVIGGNASSGTLTLSAPAPAGGTAVSLKSNQTALATVQSGVTVPAGQTTASFPIQTSVVTTSKPVLITATFSGVTISNTIISQPMFAGVSVSPTSVNGGGSVTGTVFLNANAPAGGTVVNLSSNNSAASVPPTVSVPAGMSSAQFTVTTSAVASNTPVTITASLAGASDTAGLTVIAGGGGSSISGVGAFNISNVGATIVWTTSSASDSQVAYGTTSSYGSLSPLDSAQVTSHSVNLTGLSETTLYHYQVKSRDGQGNLVTSGDFTFSTLSGPPVNPPPIFLLHGDASEVSGTINGSVVTPGTAPSGFTGTVVAAGSGSVNFAPAQSGNGVYFQNCCINTNRAYYKFTGAGVANVFNVNQGQVWFYLKSRYSFAQRQTTAATARYTFDVRDANTSNHLFFFLTQVTSGRLVFSFRTGSTASLFYYVPQGTEDTLFGNGAILKVAILWDGSNAKLYLNDGLAQTTPYTKVTPSWTAASNFDLGAYEYLSYGGYNVSDDVIDEFSVSGASDTTSPIVSMTAPANGATVSGTVTVSANATDNVGMSGVQFQLDGASLGSPVMGTGPGYSRAWNTTTASNGTHTLSAVASDAAGNTATATSISVTVSNSAPPPPVISAVSAGSITSSGATITWTTDTASDSQVAYGTTAGYGLTSTLAPALVTAHSVALSGLAASTTYHYQVLSRDAQSHLSASTDFTFTTAVTSALLQVNADGSEVSGVTNGSLITPAAGPTGFTGTLVVKGTGSVNYASVQAGNGAYFLNCCTNTNNAYYKFTGATIGNIFNVNPGQVSFFLQSRRSFAQRQASAAAVRYVYDVRDNDFNNHLFLFTTQVTSGRLVFSYRVGGTSSLFYYVPVGTEDTLFGNAVNLKVAIIWDGAVAKLYLNDTLVQTSSYVKATPNWSAASNFDLGAYEYQNYGGYNVSDDLISNFTVAAH